jgi:hypothetical protein
MELNIYYYIFILALIFYLISYLDTSKLLSIIIIIIIIIAFSFYYYYSSENITKTSEKIVESIKLPVDAFENDKKDKKDNIIQSESYYIKKYDNKFKFLIQSTELVSIVKNVKFIKKFDKSKYNNLIVNIDNLMKIYIYILADRYMINEYLPIFEDIHNTILEIFYSLIFVVPDKIKHMYGFDPYTEIEKSTKDYIEYSKNMKIILEKYSIKEKNIHHVNSNILQPYEKNKEHYLP